MKISVLHIGKYFSPFKGGIENMMHDLLLEQTRTGLEVSALVHQHEKSKPLANEYYESFHLQRIPIIGRLLFVPLAITAYWHIARFIRQKKPGILHLHMPNVSCFWLLFMKTAKNIPWVVHWHSDVVGEEPDWRIKLLYPIYRLFEQALLKRSSVIIATSPNYLAASQPLMKWMSKCHAIPIGLSTTSENKESQAVFTTPHVICIGRLTYYKGHEYLLQAINLLKAKGIHVQLRIIGEGDLIDNLKNTSSELGIDDRVIFTRQLSDEQLALEIGQCDIVCLPSIEKTEAFGLVLLEAMRAAKACICTSVPGSGMSYIVIHNQTGLVVEPQNAESLAEAIEYLTANPLEIERMGRKGQKRFIETFTVDNTASQIEALYKELL